MSNEKKAFMIGQYAAYKNKPRKCPEYLTGEARKAWYDGFDSI